MRYRDFNAVRVPNTPLTKVKWRQYKEHDKRHTFLPNGLFFWQVLLFPILANVKIVLSVL